MFSSISLSYQFFDQVINFLSFLTSLCFFFFFFLNDPAPPEISPLPLHDALPIFRSDPRRAAFSKHPEIVTCRNADRTAAGRGHTKHPVWGTVAQQGGHREPRGFAIRSEEHTSELQSPCNLVCRLLLEKQKKKTER